MRITRPTQQPTPHSMALRLALIYAAIGGTWVVFSDRLLASMHLPLGLEHLITATKGALYVVVTSLALYVLTLGMLRTLEAARDAVREQDQRIRKAYVDVIDAATGGKLVLVTADELSSALGTPLSQPHEVTDFEQLGEARDFVRRIVAGSLSAEEIDSVVLAFGEALTNALKHAGPAEYQVRLTDEGRIQVLVSDSGPGIDFTTLPKAALFPGYSTTNTLGMGYTIMLQITERVLIETSPVGTVVTLEFS